MKVAPTAKLDSGKFEIIAFHDIGVMDVAMLPKIYRGTHLDNRKVQHQSGSKIFAEINEEEASDFEMLIEADGEIVGKLPATWSIKPQCLWLLYPEPEEEPATKDEKKNSPTPIMSPRCSSPARGSPTEVTSPIMSPKKSSPTQLSLGVKSGTLSQSPRVTPLRPVSPPDSPDKDTVNSN